MFKHVSWADHFLGGGRAVVATAANIETDLANAFECEIAYARSQNRSLSGGCLW